MKYSRFLILCMLGVSTSAFAASWNVPFKKEHCTGLGVRQYAAKINAGNQDWTTACKNTAATINGQTFAGAARCIGTVLGLDGMWGQFDVKDSACVAHWDTPKDDGCRQRGVRKYSAILRDIPRHVNGTIACNATSLTLAGQHFAKPNRCSDQGVGGVWGEFDVADVNCPFWGNAAREKNKFIDKGCQGKNIRTYAARLWDTAPGTDWDKECKAKWAIVKKHPFYSPTRCVGTVLGIDGIWGEFDVIDSSCKNTALSDQQRIDLARVKYNELKPYIEQAAQNFAAYRNSVQSTRSKMVAEARVAANQTVLGQKKPPTLLTSTLKTFSKTPAARNLFVVPVDAEQTSVVPPSNKTPPMLFNAVTYGLALDLSGMGEGGMTYEWGIANPLVPSKNSNGPLSYMTFALTVGVAGGAEGSLTQGLWTPQYDALNGESWGVVIGTAPLVGANVTLWFNMSDQFIGFVLVESVGLSLEFYELDRANTEYIFN